MGETTATTPRTRKPPITPRQAMSISLWGLAIGTVLVVACALYYVPLWQALSWYAVAAFFILAFPWACLDWETRNRSVRAHNLFVYFTIAMVVVVLITQWKPKEQPFPKWAIAAIVVAGVAAYSVMARHAIANFLKWRRGGFGNNDAKK